MKDQILNIKATPSDVNKLHKNMLEKQAKLGKLEKKKPVSTFNPQSSLIFVVLNTFFDTARNNEKYASEELFERSANSFSL